MGNKDKTPSRITIIRNTFQKDCRRRSLTLKNKWAMFWSIRSITRSSPKSLYSGCNHCPKLLISCCPHSNPRGQAPSLTELTSYLSGISPQAHYLDEVEPEWPFWSTASMAVHLQTIFVIWPPHSGQAGPQSLQLTTCSLASGLCSHTLATLWSSFLLL